MSVADASSIDLIAYMPDEECVVLVMVEDRAWGQHGMRLRDLQAKIQTYLNYVASGQLTDDYPSMLGKRVRIELRSMFPLGIREEELLEIVNRHDLAQFGLNMSWRLIADNLVV